MTPAQVALAEPGLPAAQVRSHAEVARRGAGGRDTAASVGERFAASAGRNFTRLAPLFEACYTRALSSTPDIGGEVMLLVVVGGMGNVERVSSEVRGNLPEELIACVEHELRLVTFAPPPKDPGIISLPLEFRCASCASTATAPADPAPEGACRSRLRGPAPEPHLSQSFPFDLASLRAVLGPSKSEARTCRRRASGGPSGAGRVELTYAPSGQVRSVRFLSTDFEATEIGECVRAAFLNACLPAYSGVDTRVQSEFIVD